MMTVMDQTVWLLCISLPSLFFQNNQEAGPTLIPFYWRSLKVAVAVEHTARTQERKKQYRLSLFVSG